MRRERTVSVKRSEDKGQTLCADDLERSPLLPRCSQHIYFSANQVYVITEDVGKHILCRPHHP